MSEFATVEAKVFLYPWHKQFVEKIINKCSETILIPIENISVIYVYLSFPDGEDEQVLVESSQKMISMYSITSIPYVYSTCDIYSSISTSLQYDINSIIAEERIGIEQSSGVEVEVDACIEAESMFDTGMEQYNNCNFLEASKQ